MDTATGREKNVRQTTNALYPTTFMKLKLLTMRVTNDEYKKCLDEAETSFKERYMKVYEVHRPFKFFLEFEESRYNIHS